MAKPFLCRVGLAQISFNPAYADELASYIQEPAFPGEHDKTGLFSISGLEEVGQFQNSVAEKYLLHLNYKIESILRFASSDGVELLVFPEYSVPPEALPLCHALSQELGIAIVAGSHVVTLSDAARQIYHGLNLTFEGAKKPVEERVRQAACVVLVPDETPVAFVKYVRSKWEGSLVEGVPAYHAFQMKTRNGKIEVQVLICIEALSHAATKEKHTIPRLVAIPAFTPRTDPFYDEGRHALLTGKCTLFANVTEFGGSRVFARADNTSLWFTEKNGSKPLPRGSEALLVVEADLEKQFEVRQSVAEHTAVSDLRVFPILYPTMSAEAHQYSDFVHICSATSPTLPDISSQVGPFTTLKAQVLPQLLQDKLSHFVGHIAPTGIVSPEEAVRWITPLSIREIKPTDVLRWELCNESIETVNALLKSRKYVHRSKELLEVYGHLLETRNRLAGSVQTGVEEAPRPEQLSMTRGPTSTDSPFVDRDSAFDKIRQFFNQTQSSIFVLGGMRGIGKTALIQEGFRQAIPPRKPIRLQMTEGISYQRLLAELAFGCNLQLPESLKLSTVLTQEEVKKRILTYLGQGPGAVVVLDEFQYLLSSSGEIEDASIRDLLLRLAEAGQRGKTKYIFVSHMSPRLGASFESCLMPYTLHGLLPADTKRLLLTWMQFERDDLRGPFPDPSERLISILGGHPLATKLAARLWADHPTVDVAEELSIFKELRDTVVTFILEKLKLSGEERELLSFCSIFRVPAPREVFLKWRKEDASLLLNSLASRYLIESSEKGYQLHPLVRSFFSKDLSFEQLVKWHKIAGKFYLQEFDRLKESSKQVVPELLGEAVHHFLAGGDRQKVQEFAFYATELAPVALDHYRRGELKVAMKDYQVLLDLDRNDVGAHVHLSLIFARLGRWDDAEVHFGKAITLRPKAPWILQAFGAAKLRAGKMTEGESLLLEAEKANPNHSPTLVDLGRLREKQGDLSDAEAYYRRAIESDSHNSYAYYLFARLLYRQGETREAYEMAKAALVSNPLNEKNKALVQELRGKIAAASEPVKKANPTVVQVRCSDVTDRTSADERIRAIGGVNSDGKRWKISVEDAIAHIEGGKYSFFVKRDDGRSDKIVVAKAASGRKYLKSESDGAQPEKIIALPRCP